MNLPQIPQDKANHIIFGWLIYFITDLFLNGYYPLIIVIIAGIAKEIYDEFYRFGFDWKDLAATIAPAIILTLKDIIL